MIVLRRDNLLRSIRQPDHAAMAAELARAWQPPDPQRLPASIWERLIEAVEHHDDGWIAAEQKPTLDQDGRPCDFRNMPADQHVAIWRRSIDLAERRDAYEAALVALHARHLYTTTRMGDDNPAAVQAFINELNIRIGRCCEPLSLGDADELAAIEPRALQTARRLLTGFDGLSLALLGALPPDGPNGEPMLVGDRDATLQLIGAGAAWALSPWPFTTEGLKIDVPCRDVPDEGSSNPAAFAGEPNQRVSIELQPAAA